MVLQEERLKIVEEARYSPDTKKQCENNESIQYVPQPAIHMSNWKL